MCQFYTVFILKKNIVPNHGICSKSFFRSTLKLLVYQEHSTVDYKEQKWANIHSIQLESTLTLENGKCINIHVYIFVGLHICYTMKGKLQTIWLWLDFEVLHIIRNISLDICILIHSFIYHLLYSLKGTCIRMHASYYNYNILKLW